MRISNKGVTKIKKSNKNKGSREKIPLPPKTTKDPHNESLSFIYVSYCFSYRSYRTGYSLAVRPSYPTC